MVSRRLIYLAAASLFLISIGASADTIAPEWRNLQDNVTDYVEPGNPVNISAEFRDNQTGLFQGVLATNESGSWKNYTGNQIKDGFEDSDFTSEPSWIYDEISGVDPSSGTVQNSFVQEGNYAFEFEVTTQDYGDNAGSAIYYNRSRASIKDGSTYSTYIYLGDEVTQTSAYYGLFSSQFSGKYSRVDSLQDSFVGYFHEYDYDGFYAINSTGDVVGSIEANGGQHGQWIYVEMSVYPSRDTARVLMKNQTQTVIDSNITIPEGSTYSYVGALGGRFSDIFTRTGYVYFDELTYRAESSYSSPHVFDSGNGSYETASFEWSNPSFNNVLGYQIWAQDDTGNWRSTETQSFVVNQQPVIHGTSLNWTGIGDSPQKRIQYSISDPDGNQIDNHNSPPSGSEKTFTNNSYTIDGISFPFDYTVEVSDFVGATASFSTDISTSDSGYQERTSFDHSVNSQRIDRTAGLTNNGEKLNYTLSMAEIGTVIQGGSWSGSLGSGNSISKTSIWEGDYITGEAEETFSKYSDSDYGHTEDSQRIHNRTKLLADNDRSFTFHDVDISSICSRTSTADISAGSGTLVTDDCNRRTFTGDWISESLSQEYADSSYNQTVSSQRIARNKTLSEEGGYSWNQVDISSPTISGTCTDCSTRTRNIPASESVTETYHATSDWIKTESSSLYQDSSYSHDLDTQRVAKNKTLNETGGYSFTGVDVPDPALPGTVLNGGKEVDLSGGESTTLTYDADGDWIVNESLTSVTKEQNLSKTGSLGTQYVFNHTRLKADLNLSIPLTDVDISGVCSIETTGSISPSNGVLADGCTNKTYSVDKVDEALSEVRPVEETVLIGTSIRATRNLSVTNNAEYSLENLSTTDSLGQTACVQENRTEVDLAGNSSKEVTVGYQCDSGSVSDVEREVLLNTPSNFYDTVKLSFKVHVPSNVTDESDLQIMLNRDNAPEWSDRESSSVDLNASGTGIDISSTERNIYITVPDDYGNSSLHKGTYNGILKYRYRTASEGSGGGGGTGGGAPPGPEPSPQPKNNTTIKASFDTNSPYEFGYGTTRKKFITVYNFDKEPNQVTIEKQDSQACQFVDVKSAVNTQEPYRGELTTTVPSKTQGTYRESSSLLVKTRFKIPSKAKLQRMGLAGNFTCSFDTESNRGKAGNLSLTVTPVQKSSIGKSLVRVYDRCLSTDLEKAWSYPETGECPGTVVGVPVPTKASAPWLGTLLLGVLVFGWIRW